MRPTASFFVRLFMPERSPKSVQILRLKRGQKNKSSWAWLPLGDECVRVRGGDSSARRAARRGREGRYPASIAAVIDT